MTIKKSSVCFVFILLFVSLISVSYSFPEVRLEKNDYLSGEVIISGEASSGIELSLFVNDNDIDRIDLVDNATTIYLTGGISNYEVSRSSWLIFMNNHSERDYRLNIMGFANKTLKPKQTLEFLWDKREVLTIRDEIGGTRGEISVEDKLLPFVFDEINQNLFMDGENTLKFVAKSLKDKTKLETFEETIYYEKYSNVITVRDFVNITDDDEIVLMGTVSDSSYPLYYVLNHDGVIGNIGLLKSIELDGNKFNKTIGGLREGVNSIRLITTEVDRKDIFNGEKRVEVISDTVRPQFDIVGIYFSSNVDNSKKVFKEDNSFFLNEKNIILNFSTDASVLNYTLNDKNFSEELDVSLDFHELELRLKDGQNNVTLNAYDMAGNLHKEAHIFIVDTKKPKLLRGELDPQAGSKVHFPILELEGKVNKPDVELTVFTIPRDALDEDGKRVSCRNYNNQSFFIRNLRQFGSRRVFGPEVNLPEKQLSLLSLISKRKKVTSNSEGKFEILISLHEDSFRESEARRYEHASEKETSYQVEKVVSRNQVCFAMTDKFGNFVMENIDLTLDSGNTLWQVTEVVPIPNSFTVGDIESNTDLRGGFSGSEFGLQATFQYLGPGKVSRLSHFHIRKDDTRQYPDNRYISIENARLTYYFDRNTGDAIVYVPIRINPLNLPPKDYPTKLELGFGGKVTYEIKDSRIPIDERNLIYFPLTIDIDRPFDHTKWLSPKMIEGLQKYLNTTIDKVEKVTNYLGHASVVGVIACTGIRLVNTFRIAKERSKKSLSKDNEEIKNIENKIKEYRRQIFTVCDRIIGSPSPQRCEGFGDFNRSSTVGGGGIIDTKGDDYFGSGGGSVLDDAIIYKSGDGGTRDLLATFDSLKIGDPCDFYGEGKFDGVLVSGQVQRYERIEQSWLQNPNTFSRELVRPTCAPARFGKGCIDDGKEVECTGNNPIKIGGNWKRCTKSEGGEPAVLEKVPLRNGEPDVGRDKTYSECKTVKHQKVDLLEMSGVCMQTGHPKYDGTRCNFFTLDDDGVVPTWEGSGVPGKNPKDNIIESIRCGVITDTYSHSKNILKWMKSINKCLDQAKVGVVKGAYCERLFSMGVCEVVTNILYKTVGDSPKRNVGGDYHTGDGNFFTEVLRSANEGDKIINDRYDDTFLEQAGFSTQSITKNVCLAAFTGDWSVLTDNILTAVDKNQVKPTFGPMFPTSRFVGYNPITGDIAVQYKFSYYVLSGGQTVTTEIEFICDSSAPHGEYCPPGISSHGDRHIINRLRVPSLNVRRGELKSTVVPLTDRAGRFRFNIIRARHEYELDGQTLTTLSNEESIVPSDVLFARCHWKAGAFGTGTSEPSSVQGGEVAEFGGIHCDAIFTENALFSQHRLSRDATKIIPNPRGVATPVLYPGNMVNIDAFLDIRPNSVGEIDNVNLHYMFDCRQGRGSESQPKSEPLSLLNPQIIELEEIPELRKIELYPLATATLKDTGSISISGETLIRFKYEQGLFEGTPPSFDLSDVKFKIGDDEETCPSNNAVTFSGSSTTDISLSSLGDECISKIGGGVREVELRLNQVPARGVNIFLTNANGQEQKTFLPIVNLPDQNNNQLNNLRAGSCKLLLRLLPSNAGRITRDNFRNYSIVGEDIDVSRNVDLNDLLELRFTVAPNAENEDDEDVNFIFDIVRPFEKQSVCVRNKGEEQDLNVEVIISAVSNSKRFNYESEGRLVIENDNEDFDYRVSFAQQRRDSKDNKLEKIDNHIFKREGSDPIKLETELEYKDNIYKGKLKLSGYKLPTGTPEEEVTLYITYHQKSKDPKKNKEPVTISRTFRIRQCDPGTIDRITSGGVQRKEKTKTPEDGGVS